MAGCHGPDAMWASEAPVNHVSRGYFALSAQAAPTGRRICSNTRQAGVGRAPGRVALRPCGPMIAGCHAPDAQGEAEAWASEGAEKTLSCSPRDRLPQAICVMSSQRRNANHGEDPCRTTPSSRHRSLQLAWRSSVQLLGRPSRFCRRSPPPSDLTPRYCTTLLPPPPDLAAFFGTRLFFVGL